MVQLTEELVTLLDDRAARAGVSRSQVIREAVEAFVHADREAAIDRKIIEGYTRMPQGGEFDADEWGDLGMFMTALTAEQLRQEAADEQAAGLDPW